MRPDEVLYQELTNGRMEAFDELYRRYERNLFGFIVRQIGDRGEAEDVFHEAFMAVLKERRSPEALESFRAWIFQVARHLCLNRVRSRERRERALETAGRSAPEPIAHPESILASREAPEALRRAVDRLPPPLAEVYALRTAGLSYEEIAHALEVPLGTVKSRMHEMVTRLKKEVRPWTVS
ncbi:MAG: sigma-70 family RNA polymerase sigma factor [Deltaproteobacteria bacterium]|nr:sigma-70 family RNA polymerase sigma factor [Deltaproteobacteria bacterium]